MRYASIAVTLAIAFTANSPTATRAASPTGWSPIVVPTGNYRSQVKSLPIQQRPGRLLHVYGNAVRMVDQSRQGAAPRPVRQVVLGTPTLRPDRQARR